MILLNTVKTNTVATIKPASTITITSDSLYTDIRQQVQQLFLCVFFLDLDTRL